MNIIESCIARARLQKKRIVFTEAHDERVLKAVSILARDGIADPLCVGDADEINNAAKRFDIDMRGVIIIPIPQAKSSAEYVHRIVEQTKIKKDTAVGLMRKPLFFGGMMVASGDADAMVSGACTPTASVIKAAMLTVGLRSGFAKPASFMLMVHPEYNGERDALFAFTDAAVNISPSADDLAVSAVHTGKIMKGLFEREPKVAFLSFSTKGSAQHRCIDTIRNAVLFAQRLDPAMAIDGELQGDAALVTAVGARKAPGSTVAGQANVLVFPDLNAGNIAYKLVSVFGNVRAYGPFIIGLAKPVNDLSRGASVDDIVGTAAITAVRAALDI